MLADFLAMTQFAFSVTAPIFLLVLLGALFKYSKLIGEAFIEQASDLVFKCSMPLMLCISMITTNINQAFDLFFITIAVVATLVFFGLLNVIAPRVVSNKTDLGVFIQGGFRGNLAIIGLAFCANAYGEQGIAQASIVMSVLVILYNILAVITLQSSLAKHRVNLTAIMVGIVKNPLIIGIIVGVAINLFSLPIPKIVMTTGQYLAQLTLPLALLCIGASLSFHDIKTSKQAILVAVFAKLVISPLLITGLAIWAGFRGIDLAILFLMSSAPTAAVSYVMVKAMKGNENLAANIVVISTIASLFTVSLGLVILQTARLI